MFWGDGPTSRYEVFQVLPAAQRCNRGLLTRPISMHLGAINIVGNAIGGFYGS
jgi:hypothetical protein